MPRTELCRRDRAPRGAVPGERAEATSDARRAVCDDGVAPSRTTARAAADADGSFEALLQFLKRSRGFDFTGYKRASLERRFRRRMERSAARASATTSTTSRSIRTSTRQLFDTILINVTDFFRDPPAWEHCGTRRCPRCSTGKPVDEPIRVWSAGCATGQEACTIAMVLCEALGEEAYRRRVKIYATDIDEEALNVARAATYTAQEIENVPEELRERYFERSDQRFTFRADLRRTLIFGRNNLVYDAPISRLDLLICRNTLMYLTAETQAHILRHFHFALRDTGVLMLGKSEMMISHRELFAADDRRSCGSSASARARASLQARVAGLVTGEQVEYPATDEDRQLREAALERRRRSRSSSYRAPDVLSFANVAARALFGIGQRADRAAALRAARSPRSRSSSRHAVERAIAERKRRRPRRVDFPRRRASDAASTCTRAAAPLGRERRRSARWSCSRTSAAAAALESELEANRRDLEAAYEELQSTIDELETTNEELQSANEELQTTNEELQSTNEELETMNEELQSTNEELETINDELRERTNELNNVNDFLEAILTSLGVAVAVLDRNQRVQIWNRGAEELWGVRQRRGGRAALPRARHRARARAARARAARRDRAARADQRDGAAGGGEPARPHDRLRHDRDAAHAARATGRRVRGAIVLMEDRAGRRRPPA